MIFLSNDKNKMTILVILVLLFSGVVIFGWIKANPFQSTESTVNNDEWSNIASKSVDAWEKAQEGFEFVKVQTEGLGEELEKEAEQAELLDRTKEYLEDRNTSGEQQD